jgi:hypothetical protein
MRDSNLPDEYYMKDIYDVYCVLSSPERLSQNGNFRGEALKERKVRYEKALEHYCEQLGRKVSEEEAKEFIVSAAWLKMVLQQPDNIYSVHFYSNFGGAPKVMFDVYGGASYVFTKDVYETFAPWPFRV